MNAPCIVVMGVSGCGKSTIGRLLADAMGLEFIEGDSLHPPANVLRMAEGIALTDDDRRDWLTTIGTRLAAAHAAGHGVVVSCSALKRAYRDQLRSHVPDLRLVYLYGATLVLAERMAARSDHFMPATLLPSQLETLEPPGADECAIVLNINASPAQIVEGALGALAEPGRSPRSSEFIKTILFTDTNGHARFRDEAVELTEGKPQARLSPLMPSGGFQLRHSPVGFRSEFHCTEHPQWVFILGGQMEIGLQDGTSRIFKPGDHFYSADLLPDGAQFDPAIHGHWSRQLGPDPLVTVFVRG